MAKPAKFDPLAEFTSLRRRYHAQKANRSGIEQEWQEIRYYTGPLDDGSSIAQGSNGSNTAQRRKDVWDHTAIQGRERLTSRMLGSMVPSTVRWFQGTYRKAALNKTPEATKYRDELIDEVWNQISISDFYTEVASAINDTTGPGVAFFSFEPLTTGGYDAKTLREEFDGFDFSTLLYENSFFEPDRKGHVRVFWYRYMWSPSELYDFLLAKQAEATTEEERNAWAIPEDVTKNLEAGKTEPEEIVFCVFPRPEILKKKSVTYPTAAKVRPWGCMWWREEKGQKLGVDGGYYERPIYMVPWAKTSGSKWPHGPSNIALPTIKYLNGWKEQYRVAGEKSLDPSWVSNDRNILTAVDQRPGRGTVVRDVNGIKEFNSTKNFVVANDIIAEDRESIRAIYHMDDLQLKESPAMTATEVQIRYEIMSQILGKTLTNFQTFLLGPIIEAAMSMLVRFGKAPKMPKSVKDAGGIMTIEYQGPLARSQRMDEVAAIERYVAMVFGISQFEPRMRAFIDPKKIGRYIRERLGIPADLEPTEAEIDKRMKEIDEMQARAVAAEAGAKEAKASKDRAQAGQAGPVPGAQYPGLPPRPELAPSGTPVRA